MKKKKLFLSFAVFLSLSGLLFSCGPALDPNPDWGIDVSNTKDGITLNTYFPAFGQSNSKVQSGYIATQIKEKTGYEVNFNQLSEGSADTQVQAMLTGKEAVDVLKLTPTLFNNYVTDGYFTDLTDGLEKYAPNVLDLCDITEEQWEACTYNGRIYAIPEVGHTSMVNVGLVWNMDHLEEVGISKIPETISEFDTAIRALQAHYGNSAINENAANYHAFGLAGTNAEANPITAAFDMPKNWFENENGELENALFSDRTEAYLNYMHEIANLGILADGWAQQVESNIMGNFVLGNCSVANLSYWNVTNLRTQMISSYKGFPSDVISQSDREDYVYGVEDSEYGVASPDALVQWEVYLKGDGTHGTNVQEIGKARDSHGISYYIVVPVASAKRAAYSLDFINEKNTEEITRLVCAGDENVHYQVTTSDDPDAIELLTEENEPKEYIKLIQPAYDNDIRGMSQYQTGVNPSVARKWWPASEKGFDAWEVLVTNDEQLILDPFAIHPILPNFAKVDLTAQNYVITQLQNVINNGGETLANARKSYTSRFWTSKVKDEVNNWYKNK